MTQELVYPNGDRTNTLPWVNELGSSTNIYLSIDEGTQNANDTDYIDETGTASTYETDLGNTALTTVREVTLYARAKKSATGGKTKALTAKLFINSVAVVTLSWSNADLETGWMTKWNFAEGSWTQAQTNAAYIEFTTTTSGTGAARKVYVSAAAVLNEGT